MLYHDVDLFAAKPSQKRENVQSKSRQTEKVMADAMTAPVVQCPVHFKPCRFFAVLEELSIRQKEVRHV